MSNPLTRKRQLEPIQGINTQEDIESRLRGAMHPGETILSKNTKMDFRPQASLNSNLYKTSFGFSHSTIPPVKFFITSPSDLDISTVSF